MTKNRLEKLLTKGDVFEDNNSDDNSNSDDDNVLLPPEGRVISGEHIDFDTSSSDDLISNEVPSERGVRQSRVANNHVDGEHFNSTVEEYFINTHIGGNPSDNGKNDNNENCRTFTGGLGDIQENEKYSSVTYQNYIGERPNGHLDSSTNGWGNTYASSAIIFESADDNGGNNPKTIRSYKEIPLSINDEYISTILNRHSHQRMSYQTTYNSNTDSLERSADYIDRGFIGHTIYAIAHSQRNEKGYLHSGNSYPNDYERVQRVEITDENPKVINQYNNIIQAEIDFIKNIRVIEYRLNKRFTCKLPSDIFNKLADISFNMGESIFEKQWATDVATAIISFFNHLKYIDTSKIYVNPYYDLYEEAIITAWNQWDIDAKGKFTDTNNTRLMDDRQYIMNALTRYKPI